jgi:hypothetical protein
MNNWIRTYKDETNKIWRKYIDAVSQIYFIVISEM